MHNTWLVIRREYLERVRSRAFIIFTILMPLFVGAVVVLPAKLVSMKSGGQRHIAIVASDAAVAQAVVQQLTIKAAAKPSKSEFGEHPDLSGPAYKVDINLTPTDAERKKLNDQVTAGTLDGYIWLTDDAIAAGKFTYSTRNSSDFVESISIRSAVTSALMTRRLASHGISAAESESLLVPVAMETVRVEKGEERKSSGAGAFFLPFLLMMMIYMTVIIYGVAVMRSVLEEKTSRVVEVLLSSIKARELMAGKILGVGAVGLTQMLIWAGLGAIVSAPAIIAARPYLSDVQLSLPVLIAFPVFFVLGYLLYSTMYAAVGAMVNSEEEAQQMQWPFLMPLILCAVFASLVIRQPNSGLAFWTSMIPLTSPIVMFIRIVVQQPPLWQLALSIAILLLTIYGLLALCARIYRVGILMYGKKPTLPELMKWIRYAG